MHIQNTSGYSFNQRSTTSNNANNASFLSSQSQESNNSNNGFGKFSNTTFIPLLLNLILSLLQALTESNSESNANQNMENASSVSSKQVFNTPASAAEPGPALPGDTYETTFTAKPGENLSFASMFVQSNDLFFSPDEYGIPLFDQAGQPLEGDVTDYVSLWDAGTELNEPVGTGENQAPRQSGPNTGASDPDQRVRKVYDLRDELPPANELVKAEIEYLGDDQFKLKLTNISDSSSLASPLAPGIAVVHSDPAPIFSALQADRGLGLEALAEDGDPSVLLAQL